MYASLAATLFLYLYSKYYVVKVNNNIHAFRDNQSNVNKVTWPLEDEYHHHGLHKKYRSRSTIPHLKVSSLQLFNRTRSRTKDDEKYYNVLDVKVQLNIDADIIVTKIASLLINILIISIPFAFYINDKNTHHRPDYFTRVSSHSSED